MPLPSFFSLADGVFTPQRTSLGSWAPHSLNGPAVTGILARCLETDHAQEGFQPSRLTVDLFRTVAADPFTVQTTIARDGRRIRVADASLVQGGVVVARASAVWLATSSEPEGARWSRPSAPQPPAPEVVAAGENPLLPVLGSDIGWTNSFPEHHGASRKRIWITATSVVEGEEASPFVRAAVACDATNLLTSWGDTGVQFINSDVTLALARLPLGDGVGLEADNHVSAGGIAIGSATMFDSAGVVGTTMVTSLANGSPQFRAARRFEA